MTGNDWGDTSVEDVRKRIIQSNDIAAIVEDIFGSYVPLNVRYGIADALWDAGYRKVPNLDPKPYTFQAGRFKEADTYGDRRFNPRPEYSQNPGDYPRYGEN